MRTKPNVARAVGENIFHGFHGRQVMEGMRKTERNTDKTEQTMRSKAST